MTEVNNPKMHNLKLKVVGYIKKIMVSFKGLSLVRYK